MAPPKDSNDQEELLDFSIYTHVVHRMMKQLGYDFKSKLGLNFGKGRHAILPPKI